MMRYAVMLALLAVALPAEAGANWERLWFNADQRGEKLLQHGDAGDAAKIYKDPRRRAYAEMKAGNYRQAASELGKMQDSDSDYNRGNALAKSGDLTGALDAYNAALKRDPKNHDAQNNRDLVEKALKQQPPQQKNGQQNGKPQDNKSGKNANGANGNSGQPSSSNNSGKSGGNPSGANSAGQQNTQAGVNGNQTQQNPQQNPGQQNSGQQGPDANNAAQPGQGHSGTADRQQATKSSNPSANGQSADAAAQARQDAEAGLAANKPAPPGNRIANAAPTDQTAPLSEQQLSKEQWLRNIPDDPGGLLRRKFMIEHMLRQQRAPQ